MPPPHPRSRRLLATLPAPAAEPTPEDAKLAALFRTYLDEEFRRHPFFATQQGNHDHDDRLDDLSPAGPGRGRRAGRRHVLDGLAEGGRRRQALPGRADRLRDLDARPRLRSSGRSRTTNRFEFDPRVYGEYISDSVFLLFTQSTLPRERNVANAAKRIALHPEGRRRGEGGAEEPAEGPHRDRHQAEPRGHRLLREGHLRVRRRDARHERARRPVPGGGQGAQGLPGVPGEGTAAAVHRRVAARQGEVRQEARARTRRRADRRRGDQARRGRGRPRRAGDVLRRQAALVEAVPRQAAAAGRPGRPAGRRSSASSTNSARTTASPRTLVADAKQTVEKIKAFIREKRHPDAAGPGHVPGDRDAGVPARLLGGVPEPGPAARPEGGQPVRRRPAAGGLAGRPPRDVPPRVQPGDAPDPHHPRGVPGPLRPARVLEPLPVAGAQGAVLRRRSPRAGRCTPSR